LGDRHLQGPGWYLADPSKYGNTSIPGMSLVLFLLLNDTNLKLIYRSIDSHTQREREREKEGS